MTNSSVFYPMEAFALAMVLYSGGMKEAMLAGIGLILGDVLLHVLQDNFRDKYQRAFSGMGILVTVAVLTYCWDMAGLPVDVKTLLGFGAMVLLLGKQHDDLEKACAVVANSMSDQFAANTEAMKVGGRFSPDYNRILWADSVAYGFLVLLSMVREFMSGGSMFQVELTEWSILSQAYGSPMLALILAGIMLAATNAALKTEFKKDAALWVCIPTILLETPFVLNHVPEWLGTMIGVLFMLILYYTFRKKIFHPAVSKYFRGIPVELVTLGMMYMIFSIL